MTVVRGVGLLCVVGLVAVASRATPIQDRAKVVPSMEVLLENSRVRVQYHDVAVGEKIPMHSHPPHVIYVLTPCKARITLPDGRQTVFEAKAGEVFWREANMHAVENIGTAPIHNLVVELKGR